MDKDQKEREEESQEEPQGSGDGDGDGKTEAERESEKLQERVKELEKDPPEKLEDWPDDETKYQTFGGPEGEHGYHEGPEQKLGESDVRHHEDGSVELRGEDVDDPKDFKAEPIPGGPTDPDTPNLRMDRASPEDRSDIAKDVSGDEGEEGGDSESSEDDGDKDE